MKRGIFLVLLIFGLLLVSGCYIKQPTRAEVEDFLKDKCNSELENLDLYTAEYECAKGIRSFWNYYFKGWKFHYFNYWILNDSTLKGDHIYLFIKTSDEGVAVFNQMNGSFVGLYHDLMLSMGCEVKPGEDLYSANNICHFNRMESLIEELREEREEQLVVQKSCEFEKLEEYRCNEINTGIEQKWQFSNCSLAWAYHESCAFGCENAECEPCYDSDGGKNYYTKGFIYYSVKNEDHVYLSMEKVFDECSKEYGGYLIEHYCVDYEDEDYKNFKMEPYKCPIGCSDGKCCNSEAECKDGFLSCHSGPLEEYRCNGIDLEQKHQFSDCSFDWAFYERCDYGCSDGKCNLKSQLTKGTVSRVIDGYTIQLSTGEEVRFIGINYDMSLEKGEECYQEAKEFLEWSILGREVFLERDIEDKDQYGRLLRYVFVVDDIVSIGKVYNVNRGLIAQGFAKKYEDGSNTKYSSWFEEAEDMAKEIEGCLWKTS